MTEVATTPGLADRFEQQPLVAYVQADTFCEGCGYNLHGQKVRREPELQLLLVRCPECGRFGVANDLATVGRLWLQRLATLLLLGWVLVLLGVGFLEGALEVALAWEGTQFGWLRALEAWAGVAAGPGRRIDPYAPQVLATMLALMAAMGWAVTVVSTAVFPHWRRWGYWVFVGVRGGLLVGVTWVCATADRGVMPPGRFVIGLAVFGLAQMVGGGIGVLVGRPLMRALVTLFLPRRVRIYLGYLWTVDGKVPPRADQGLGQGSRASL